KLVNKKTSTRHQQSARTFACARFHGVAFTLKCLRTHRARWREKESLPKSNIVVEQIDNRRLCFYPLGDQIDARTCHQAREVLGIDVALIEAGLIQQEPSRNLEKTERAVGEFIRLHVQIGDMIHGKAEAAFGKRRQTLVFDGTEVAIGLLREFEHQ